MGTGPSRRVGSRGSATATHRPSRSPRPSEGHAPQRHAGRVGRRCLWTMHCELDLFASFGNVTLANLSVRKTNAEKRCAANSRPDQPDAPKWKSTPKIWFRFREIGAFRFSANSQTVYPYADLRRKRRKTKKRASARAKRRSHVSIGRVPKAFALHCSRPHLPKMTSTLAYAIRVPAATLSRARAPHRGEPLSRARALSGIKTPARFSSVRAKRHRLDARTVATAVVEPSSEAARVEEVKLSSNVLPGTAPSNAPPEDRTFIAKGANDATCPFFARSDAHLKGRNARTAPSVSSPRFRSRAFATPRGLETGPNTRPSRDAFPETDPKLTSALPRVAPLIHYRSIQTSQCVSSAPTAKGSWRA